MYFLVLVQVTSALYSTKLRFGSQLQYRHIAPSLQQIKCNVIWSIRMLKITRLSFPVIIFNLNFAFAVHQLDVLAGWRPRTPSRPACVTQRSGAPRFMRGQPKNSAVCVSAQTPTSIKTLFFTDIKNVLRFKYLWSAVLNIPFRHWSVGRAAYCSCWVAMLSLCRLWSPGRKEQSPSLFFCFFLTKFPFSLLRNFDLKASR